METVELNCDKRLGRNSASDLKVYTIPPSLYCAKLRILLRHKQLQWQELPPPGGYGSDEYKLIVPSGNLPALVLDHDQGVLGDSEAIAEYLNERYPFPAMLPDTELARARCRERSRFHDTRLEPEIRKIFPQITPAEKDLSLLETQSRMINQRLWQLEKLLESTPQEELQDLTLADCGFIISFSWLQHLTEPLALEISWPSTVLEYARRLQSHAAVSDELTNYRPVLQAWLTTALTDNEA